MDGRAKCKEQRFRKSGYLRRLVSMDVEVSASSTFDVCEVDRPELRASANRRATFHENAGATAGVNKKEKLRFMVLDDVKGQTVTIVVEFSAPGFEGFLPKAQQVIKMVGWKGT